MTSTSGPACICVFTLYLDFLCRKTSTHQEVRGQASAAILDGLPGLKRKPPLPRGLSQKVPTAGDCSVSQRRSSLRSPPKRVASATSNSRLEVARLFARLRGRRLEAPRVPP